MFPVVTVDGVGYCIDSISIVETTVTKGIACKAREEALPTVKASNAPPT
jgi:hypothetical protein